jgi:D-glycero-alpha-D-manno-heptose-7-phosphate kinase
MIISRTPFRLPLGGGGTDLPSYYHKNEGFLITAAINKYMYISINEPAIVNKIKINYSKVEIVEIEQVAELKHEIVRETLKYLNIKRPLEISSMADLSAGTGMGSSSSYTVGLLQALNAMLRRHISIKELAEEACKVEIELISKPIGKQDQYAAAFGGIIQLEIDRLGSVTVTSLKIDHEIIYELENRLMMFYTDIERDANLILGEQSRKIEGTVTRQKEAGQAERRVTSNSTVDAMHKIKEIGYEVKEALIKGEVCTFGKLLNEHWLVKKSVSDKMSNPDIDHWYDLAMANGALGGKVMGAGGGGFLLFCVSDGKRKHLRKTLEDAGLRYMNFKFDWEGVKTLVNI